VLLRDLDHASASLLPPMPRASTPEEHLTMFDDDFFSEYDTPLVFYIVPEDSSIHALLAAFQNFPNSECSFAHSASDRDTRLVKLLEGMFYSVTGLNVGCRTYHEDSMHRSVELVAGIHQFEDSGKAPISLGGIAIDNAAPKVTYGSSCVLKITLAEGFSIHIGTPFRRKAKLTYMTHMNQVVSSLWGFDISSLLQEVGIHS
jgi:hypothetical protein